MAKVITLRLSEEEYERISAAAKGEHRPISNFITARVIKDIEESYYVDPGFLPQPEKDLERPSSTRLEARFPYHGSGAMTRSPSPLAWRPDFPGAPREAH